MNGKTFVLTSCAVALIAGGMYQQQAIRKKAIHPLATDRMPVFLAVSPQNWTPPKCEHGYEPGGGPIRCADPNNPDSYLYKKQKAQEAAAEEQKRAAAREKAEAASRPYSIENPPKDDPKYCINHAKSATDLDRCWRRQHGEAMPEDYRVSPSAGNTTNPKRYDGSLEPAVNGVCSGGKLYNKGWCR